MRKRIYLPKTLKEIQSLESEKTKELWLRYFKEPPRINDQKMIRILWYKVQCENHNLQTEQKNITRLNRYSTDPDKYIKKSFKTKYSIKSGIEIVKTFKDKQYKVYVKSPDEFIYDDKSFKTLSAVAMAICGKKVSGYDFFGIKNKNYEKSIIKNKEAEEVSEELNFDDITDYITDVDNPDYSDELLNSHDESEEGNNKRNKMNLHLKKSKVLDEEAEFCKK